jgi:hypothetical protein
VSGGLLACSASVGAIESRLSGGLLDGNASVGAIESRLSGGLLDGSASVGAIESRLSGGLLDGSASVGVIESRLILHWRQEHYLLRQDSVCSVAHRNLDPENGGSGLLRNVDKTLPNYTASHSRKLLYYSWMLL